MMGSQNMQVVINQLELRENHREIKMTLNSPRSVAVCLILLFIVVIDRLPNFSCLCRPSPAQKSPFLSTNDTSNVSPSQEDKSNSSQAVFNCQEFRQRNLVAPSKTNRGHDLHYDASSSSSRVFDNAKQEEEADQDLGEFLQVAASNNSVLKFKAPTSAELVFDPISSPVLNPTTGMVGNTHMINSTRLMVQNFPNNSVLMRQGDKQLGLQQDRWQPIRKRAPGVIVNTLHKKNYYIPWTDTKPTTNESTHLQIAPKPFALTFATNMIADNNPDRKYINFSHFTREAGRSGRIAAQVPMRQRRFSFLNSRQPQSVQAMPNGANFEPGQMRDLQESAHTSNIQLASPLSQYLLQQLLASQQQRSSSLPGTFIDPISAGPNNLASQLGPFVPQQEPHSSTAPPSPHQAASGAGVPQANLAQFNFQPNAGPLMSGGFHGSSSIVQPPVRSDIGEDGSSMVTYSLVPQGQENEQHQQQAIGSLSGRPDMGDPSTMSGLSHEQLLNAIGHLGQQPASASHQLADIADQQLEQLPGPNSIDSALISFVENMIKSNTNQIQQSQSVSNNQQQQQQQPQQQQQQQQQDLLQHQSIAQLAANIIKQQATTAPNQNRTNAGAISNAAHQTGSEIKFPQAHANAYQRHVGEQNQNMQTLIYPQDSQLDPMFSTGPKRRPKKKRKKQDKWESVKNPIVRVSKRPRAGPQQQFYEHNSPTDLQPSATFHKWKYPWLYRPPYDDDEDEEEGETEINLRFFNNFSRMGPFQGIARTAAPVTFFISLIFLILSNVSLAATVIVHGISAFLRNISSHQSPLASSAPNKVSTRLAKLLTNESPNRATTQLKAKNLTTVQPASMNTTMASRQPKRMKLDRMIKSFASAWKSEF